MVFLTQIEKDDVQLEKGIFISFEMSKHLAKEISSGNVTLNNRLFPVHIPSEGLLKLDFTEHNNLKIEEEEWRHAGLPSIYNGEDLNTKKLIIFPMHGLGDQLYLAVAIRNLAKIYQNVDVFIVKPSMTFSEQWYDYIYFDEFYTITGPVVTIDEMKGYDYYVPAEHFSYLEDYKGTYPPEFYTTYLFFHDAGAVRGLKPEISTCRMDNAENKRTIDERLKNEKKIVFVNPVTTGRVRDIPDAAVLDFVDRIKDDYLIIVSTYKNLPLNEAIERLNLSNVISADQYISHIDDLVYLLSCVDYIITSDSGITHLAEVLEIPCGSVFNVVTPEERTKPYIFSEQLMVEFEIPDVCKTPCYIHALEDSELCPGMEWKNKEVGVSKTGRYAPCMDNFTGEHLVVLFDALIEKFDRKRNEVSTIDDIISANVFRSDVYDIIPEEAVKILDFGCHQAELLLRLKRDKGCRDLYGIEIHDTHKDIHEKYLDGYWVIDLGDQKAELEESYLNYFNYIIMHDVVEHLYDPWYVVEKLRKYLSNDGKIVMVVPNLQYWGIVNQIVNGDFPYGAGGLMNEDHIRWFTCKSIIELALLSGYSIDYFTPLFPPGTDLSQYEQKNIKKQLKLPPDESQANAEQFIDINFRDDLKKNYYLFLANKILLLCSNTDRPVDPKQLIVGELQKRKDNSGIDFKCKLI